MELPRDSANVESMDENHLNLCWIGLALFTSGETKSKMFTATLLEAEIN